MDLILFITAALASIFIIYQDIKSRRINLLLTLAFTVLIAVRYYFLNTTQQLLINALFCLLYFLLSYTILRLYFFIRTGTSQKIIDSKIGWGDIILLYAIGCTIEPEKLIFFFTAVFVISLLLHVLILSKYKQIPLAAYLLIFYNVYLISGFL